jgi:hypothetical protein
VTDEDELRALSRALPSVQLSVQGLDARSSVPRCRYHSSLRLPLVYSHPYRQITVETEFDNPTYETGVSAVPGRPPGRRLGKGHGGRHLRAETLGHFVPGSPLARGGTEPMEHGAVTEAAARCPVWRRTAVSPDVTR